MQARLTTKDLLLAKKLTEHQVAALLKPFGFSDMKKADANLQSIGKNPGERILFSEILEETLQAFSESPDPDSGLNNFERYSQTALSKTQFFSYLKESPRTLYHAARVFGGSPFLSDILIRNPEYFYWVFDLDLLNHTKPKRVFRKELSAALRLLISKEAKLDMLRIYKRKEILRIGVRDLVGAVEVRETMRDVSNLADILIEKAHTICARALRQKYGKPALSGQFDNKGIMLPGFTVLALGKLGSRELNFSSDVDLIYLYDSREGKTSGQKGVNSIQNALYFEYLAKEITSALNSKTGQGYVYRVDLRLRPEGETGLITLPLEAYYRYYKKRGETWERMVLLRARPVSGDHLMGKDFLKRVFPFIFEKPCGKNEFRAIRDFKEKIDEAVATRRQLLLDVKRGTGGIREIEFILHTLQLKYAGGDAKLRKQGTIRVLKRLAEKSLLSRKTETLLAEAYLFLRDVENKLQMLNDYQTHLLPTSPKETDALACRLGYPKTDCNSPSVQFESDYLCHTQGVHQVYKTFFFSQDVK